jgi:ring-1,2-phenylacetyl-CoA epoxidase subunit PaaE
MTPRFHRLRIAEVRRETPDAVSIAFAVPEEARQDFAFSCGQYLTLRTMIDGEDIRRSYSICSGVDDDELRVAVKRVDGGLFSSFVSEGIKEGDEIDVMTPAGRFTVDIRPDEARTFVGFASGSGITPVLSIVRTVLSREPKSRFFLFYGNRTTNSILFRETLDDLKDRFLDRLSIFHVLSREQQDVPILNGRLDAEKVSVLLRSIVPASIVDHAFICGPASMIDEIEGALLGLGVASDRVHVERFTPAPVTGPRRPAATAPKPPADAGAAVEAARARLILDGKTAEVPVASGETVLEAALRAGLDLPYSCRGGMCCTCRAKVVEGAVEMAVNYSLEPWEMQAGFVLTCQALPTTDHVTIDYDHV